MEEWSLLASDVAGTLEDRCLAPLVAISPSFPHMRRPSGRGGEDVNRTIKMKPQWQPFQEPIWRTFLRTITIALLVGAAIALQSRRWSSWPLATLLVLWPSLGGHWVEVWFLNWLRPRISRSFGVQKTTRVLVWFAAGYLLALGMSLTASVFVQWRSPRWLTWWLPGAAFIGIELVAHLALQLRGRPSFYNGRG